MGYIEPWASAGGGDKSTHEKDISAATRLAQEFSES